MTEKTSVIFGVDGRIGSLLQSAITARGESTVGVFGAISTQIYFGDSVPDVVYICAGNSDPNAALEEHQTTIDIATHILSQCAERGVPKVYLCGSSWADPITDDREQNERTAAYGAAKRAIRDMAATYPGDAHYVRLGWYPATPMPDDAPDWRLSDFQGWNSPERICSQIALKG
ncbi:NAD-dependent epimerase/dehydratase family protein [Agrobacterium vitis]